MSIWYTINLGDAMLAVESLDQIKNIFLLEYSKRESPKDIALFVRHESEGRLHCEVKIYFSPASFFVAEAVGAIPCTKPSPYGLDLLAGSAESWTTLFPENGN
ncbi:MAG: hypothetical protein KZQ91_13055 [Candidatus Thiodiazotropha sp. (ex Lucinoma borealis)]|nr:hypothetical protein [Candidatus Thiodiazotropha sp. (ex Lucinoma borealis)]